MFATNTVFLLKFATLVHKVYAMDHSKWRNLTKPIEYYSQRQGVNE